MNQTRLVCAFAALFLFLFGPVSRAIMGEPVPAIHKQGSVHGFLAVKSADGKIIGMADLINVTRGNTVRSRLTIRFRDGSLDDETTVFTQGTTFKVLSGHHIQKGPSFPQPLDLAYNTATATITWHEFKDGKDEVKTDHMELPENLANGIIPLVIENFRRDQGQVKVSYLTGEPKPRVVKPAVASGTGRRSGRGQRCRHPVSLDFSSHIAEHMIAESLVEATSIDTSPYGDLYKATCCSPA